MNRFNKERFCVVKKMIVRFLDYSFSVFRFVIKVFVNSAVVCCVVEARVLVELFVSGL